MAEKIQLTVEANLALNGIKAGAEQMKRILQNAAKLGIPSSATAGFEKRLQSLTGDIENFAARAKDGFESVGEAKGAEHVLEKMKTQLSALGNSFEDLNLNPEKLLPKETLTQFKELDKILEQVKQNSDIEFQSKNLKDQIKEAEKFRDSLIEAKRAAELDASNTKALNATQLTGLYTQLQGQEEKVESLKTKWEDLKAAQEAAKTNQDAQDLGFKDLSDIAAKVQKAAENLANARIALGKIQTAIGKKEAENQAADDNVAEIDAKITAANKHAEQLRESLSSISGQKITTEGLTKLKEDLTKIVGESDELKAKISQIDSVDSLKNFINSFQGDKIQAFTAALEPLGLELKEVDGSLQIVKKSVEENIDSLKQQDAQAAEVNGIKARITAFLGLNNAINLARNAIRNAFNSIKDLDKAMTETAVVTNFSVGDMWQQLPQYTAAANELGTTTLGAYQTMTLFYQQGLDTNQTFAIGTETMKMARIAGLDYADATNLMTAALRGFNMELNETSATRVNDVYSKLAAITAANTQEIATAMTKTASIANGANMEFETTAAFLSQIIETTRESAETAGTAMKTIIARFSEVKKLYTEGQLTGTDEDGEVININKIDAALKTVGISLKEFIAGNKGLDEIFLELASKWDTLDMATQRYIATMAAGSRQQSRFIAMMSDYDRTLQLVDAANTSAGASQQQFEKTLESLESKINALKNAWQEFTMGLANDDLVKSAVDTLTAILNVINKITEVFGSSGGAAKILLFVAGFGTAKIVIKSVFDTLENGEPVLVNIAKRWEELGKKAKKAQQETSEASTSLQTSANNEGSKVPGALRGAAQSLNGGEKGQKIANTASIMSGLIAASSGLAASAAQANAWGEGWSTALNDVSKAAMGASVAFQALKLLKITNPWVLAATAALAALVPVIKAVNRYAQENSAEGKLKTVKKAAEAAQQAAKKTQEAYNSLLTMGDKKTALEERLASLKQGTEEWKEALIEANEHVLEMVKAQPELKEFLTSEETGQLTFEEDAFKEYKENLRKGVERSQASALYASAFESEQEANYVQNFGKLGEFLKDLESSNLTEDSNLASFAKLYGINDAKSLERFKNNLDNSNDLVYGKNERQAREEERNRLKQQVTALENAYSKNYQPEIDRNKLASEKTYKALASQLTMEIEADSDVKKFFNGQLASNLQKQNIEGRTLELQSLDAEALKRSYNTLFGISFESVQEQFLDSTGKLNKKLLAQEIATQEAITEVYGEGGEQRLKDLQKLFTSENSDGLQGNKKVIKGLMGETSDWSTIGEILAQGDNIEDIFAADKDKIRAAMGWENDDAAWESFIEQQKNNLQSYVDKTANMLGDLTAKATLSGVTLDLEDLSLDEASLINDIGNTLQQALGSSGLKAWGERISGIINAEDLEKAQELINSINFNNPISATKALTAAAKSGSESIRNFANSILQYNQNTLGAQAQFKYFVESAEYGEMREELDSLIKTQGKLNSSNIEDLIEKNSILKDVMETTGLGAEGMAAVLTGLTNGEIELTNVTNNLISALSKLGSFDSYFSKLSQDLANLNIQDTEGDIRKSVNGVIDNLGTAVLDEGRYGSGLVNDSLTALFGDNYLEAIQGQDSESKKNIIDQYVNAAKNKFRGNDYFDTWDDLINGKIVTGEESKVESSTDWSDGYKRTTYTTGKGKFSIGKKGNEYKLEGYENFDSVEEFTTAISEAYGVSEQVAGAMVANFKEYSLDFQQWSAEIEAKRGLSDLLSGHVDVSDITTYMQLMGLTKTQAEGVAAALEKIVKNNGELDAEGVKNTLGLKGENAVADAQAIADGINIINETADQGKLDELNIDDLLKDVTDAKTQAEALFQSLLATKRLQNESKDKGPQITNYGDKTGKDLADEAGISRESVFGLDSSSQKAVLNMKALQTQMNNAELNPIQQEDVSKYIIQGYSQAQTVINGNPITIDIEPGDSLEDLNGKVEAKLQEINAQQIGAAMADAFATGFVVKDKEIKVTVNSNAEEVKNAVESIPEDITVTVTAHLEADGTTLTVTAAATGGIVGSFAKGGKIGSYANGKLGSNRRLSPGMALTGEEGPEIVWNKEKQYSYIVGENGPEFANLQPGDQVFSNPDTKKILRNGLNPLGSYAKGTFGSLATASRPTSGTTGRLGSSDASASIDSSSTSESDKKWKNSIDWFYNYIQRTNAALKIREKYERQYNLFLKKHNTTLYDLIKNYKKSSAALEFEKQEWKVMQKKADARIEGLSNSAAGKKYKDYVAYAKDEETGVYRTVIDWAKINKITDQKKGEAVSKYLSELQSAVDHANESLEKLDDIKDQMIELTRRGKQEYLSIEDRVMEALKQSRQNEIDEMQKSSDAISESTAKIIDSIQKQIEETRRIRENLKTEQDLAEKQRRLAYLQQDTSNGNLLEALKLQRELETAQQDYTDSLIDQKLDDMSEDNEKAQEQREHQIELLQASLDYDIEQGALWKEVHDLLNASLSESGTLITTSSLVDLLKNEEGFMGLSAIGKMDWLNDLETAVITGFAWLKTGATSVKDQLLSGDLKTGQEVSLKNPDGTNIKGTLLKDGDVMDEQGYRYSGVSMDEEGNFSYQEKTWDHSDHALSTEDRGGETGFKFIDKEGAEITGTVLDNGDVLSEKGYHYTGIFKDEDGKYKTEEEKTWENTDHLLGLQGEAAGSKFTVRYGKDKKQKGTFYFTTGINGKVVSSKGKGLSGVYLASDGKYYSDQTSLKSYKVSGFKTMKKGASGSSVKTLQSTLKFLGYSIGSDKNGKFGSGTATALKKFQKARGLSQTGKFDTKTKKKFKSMKFKTGGLADFTGPAWLDGTKSKPEIVLNQQDSKNFMLLKDILSDFIRKGGSSSSSETNGDNYYEIDIHVDSMSSDYDVDKMASRIKKLITQDSMYRNVNTINRLR